MGLFSDSKSTVTNQTTTQNTGFSEVGGPALALQGSGNSVAFSDQGAISAAQSIALRSLDAIESAGSQTKDTVARAVAAVSESARAETENIAVQGFKWAAIAVGVYAAAVVLRAWVAK